MRSSVGKATLVINAADITSSSQDALVTRVTDGFQDLISRTYTQLKLLGGVTYSEQQVAWAANPDSGLFDADTMSKLSVPAEEVLSFVMRKENLGEQVTVKTIVDSFQTKPYGWDLASIEVLVAFLVGTSKVTLTVDGNVLKRSEVAAALRNTQKQPHTVVAPQKTFDERKVAAFRKFCTDFFDEANAPKDPLELARHGADKLKGQARRTQGHRHAAPSTRSWPAHRTDRAARPGRRQARRLVPDRLRPWRRPARRQGEPHRPDPGVPQRRAAASSTTRLQHC